MKIFSAFVLVLFLSTPVPAIQEIEGANMSLISSILELNRFRYLDDLSEAEAALEEIVDLDWEPLASRFGLPGLLS